MKFSVEVSCYFTIINYNFTEKLLRNSKTSAAELTHFYEKLLFSHSQFLQLFPVYLPCYPIMMSHPWTATFLSENYLCKWHGRL